VSVPEKNAKTVTKGFIVVTKLVNTFIMTLMFAS